MFPFHTSWKLQKTFTFLGFSGGIICENWQGMGHWYSIAKIDNKDNVGTYLSTDLFFEPGQAG